MNSDRLKRFLPLLLFLAGLIIIPNLWRVELWWNPVQNQASSVTLYSTRWCPYCDKAKRYFEAAGVHYMELDIEQSQAARRDYDRLGGRGVPLIVIDGKKVQGFRPEAIRQLLERSPTASEGGQHKP